MTSTAYVIEVQDATAGIVVRDARGYRFFAANPQFQSLEGRVFGHPNKAERAARNLLALRN